MTSVFQMAVLGVIQGLSEFLPVSSSAHLILLPRYFHWADPGLAFDVALHLGTLLAVLTYFWKDLMAYLKAILEPKNPALAGDRRVMGYLALATIPGALAGLALEHKAEAAFRSPALIACALIGLGLLLALADRLTRGDKGLADLTWRTALLLGVAQSLALIPGVSRSGITITTALFLGMERGSAARFSFLMSLPIIAGAGVLKFKEILISPDKFGLAVGVASAAVAGFLAIWLLMRYVQNHRYTPFVIYRWALGAFVLLNLSHFQ